MRTESVVTLRLYTQMFVNDSAQLFGMLHRLHGRAEQLGRTDGTPL